MNKNIIKIVIVSDSHGSYLKLKEIVEKENPFDYLIHCGDGVADLFQVEIPENVKIVKVSGNVDLVRGYDIGRIEILFINDLKILIAHGDKFQVRNDYEYIINEGKKHNVDMIFFGHTHRQYLREGKPGLFNPGSVSKGQYGIVSINSSVDFKHTRLI